MALCYSPDRYRVQALAERADRRTDRRYRAAIAAGNPMGSASALWIDAAMLRGRLERRAEALRARDIDRASTRTY